MKQLSIREVRAALGRLDEILAEEGEIEITRHGKPVARIVPMPSTKKLPSRADFRAKMPRMKIGSEHYIREDRDSGP